MSKYTEHVALSRYAKFAWAVLGFTVVVILWGAFVRASGSGAGCGGHWPLCNGVVVPHSPKVATLIEFTHRITSGVALLLIVGLVIGAWRLFPRGHRVRLGAAVSGFFIITEALIGAGLVLLHLVAKNASPTRGYWVAGHLLNTFLLLAAVAITAWWASGGAPVRPRRGRTSLIVAIALGSVLLLGVSGAVTALGDTLFPATSLAQAEVQTFSPTANIFIRLRIWHPTLALAIGIYLLFAIAYLGTAHPAATSRKLGTALLCVYVLQIALGALNVWFLAPIAIQIVHLLCSDVIWILLVLLSASVLAEEPVAVQAAAA